MLRQVEESPTIASFLLWGTTENILLNIDVSTIIKINIFKYRNLNKLAESQDRMFLLSLFHFICHHRNYGCMVIIRIPESCHWTSLFILKMTR